MKPTEPKPDRHPVHGKSPFVRKGVEFKKELPDSGLLDLLETKEFNKLYKARHREHSIRLL